MKASGQMSEDRDQRAGKSFGITASKRISAAVLLAIPASMAVYHLLSSWGF